MSIVKKLFSQTGTGNCITCKTVGFKAQACAY